MKITKIKFRQLNLSDRLWSYKGRSQPHISLSTAPTENLSHQGSVWASSKIFLINQHSVPGFHNCGLSFQALNQRLIKHILWRLEKVLGCLLSMPLIIMMKVNYNLLIEVKCSHQLNCIIYYILPYSGALE